jgi:diaminopimelate epimerase
MNLKFYKLHCAISDLILLDLSECAADALPSFDALAKAACGRKRGIGASLLAVLLRTGPDFLLRAFLPSGEEAETVNDAAVGAARYIIDSGLVGSDFTLRTIKGALRIEAVDSDSVRIPLGKPEKAGGGAATEADIAGKRLVVEAPNSRLSVFPVKVGHDYAVSFFESSKQASLRRLKESGIRERAPDFVPLAVRVVSRDEFRVYAPMGSIIDSCSAAAAAHVACVSAGFCERTAAAVLPSGIIFVNWVEDGGELFVAASAEYVFEGEYWFSEVGKGQEGL